MEQLKQFEIEKKLVIEKIQLLKTMVGGLSALDIDVSGDIEKLDATINAINSNVLRIALLGAFSDGKTSVIAAWLGKIMEDMKIDMDESSDQIAIYVPKGLPEHCEIVDTPGLFGDKQKQDGGNEVFYEDITRKYISEAHIIFYVVDATNPLKESHNSSVKWVLRDLNKLDSTIFIINKMDEVTDLSDSDLFSEQAKVKIDTLKSKLQRVVDLTELETSALKIVCISSNPNGRGLPFWFEKLDLYRQRSRIDDLKSLTSEILKSNVRHSIIAKTGLDVISDVVVQKLAIAEKKLNEMTVFSGHLDQEFARISDDINSASKEVKSLARDLGNELDVLEKDLLGKLRPLSLTDIRAFIEDELGLTESEFGYKLDMKIKTTIDSYYSKTTIVTSNIEREIKSQLDSSMSFLDSIGGNVVDYAGKGLNSVSKINPAVLKESIFAARDALAKATGYVFKFKPHGAAKLAGNIAKWAGPAAVAINVISDTVSLLKAQQLENELKETKNEISEMIKSSLKDIYDIIRDDKKLFDFFAPEINAYVEVAEQIKQQRNEINQLENVVVNIKKNLSSLA